MKEYWENQEGIDREKHLDMVKKSFPRVHMKQLEEEIDYLFGLALVDFDNEMVAAGLEVPRDAAINHLRKFIQSQLSQAYKEGELSAAKMNKDGIEDIVADRLSQQRQEVLADLDTKIDEMVIGDGWKRTEQEPVFSQGIYEEGYNKALADVRQIVREIN